MFLGLMNPHAPRGKSLAVALVAAWTSIAAAASSPSEQAGSSQKSFHCMPCSMTYVSDAYPSALTPPLAQHNDLADVPDSSDLCRGITNYLDVPVLLESHRQLVGEGSHRRLIYSMKFGNSKDTLVKFLDGHDANLVIIESLPSGVFVDPFELHHFVERKVFLDVAVFGDTNLELPSALSNPSAVEIHFDLKPSTSMNFNLVMELPLHARYPPLDARGYVAVEFGSPDLLLRYRRKETHPDSCLWVLQKLDAALWRKPRGAYPVATKRTQHLSSVVLSFAACGQTGPSEIRETMGDYHEHLASMQMGLGDGIRYDLNIKF